MTHLPDPKPIVEYKVYVRIDLSSIPNTPVTKVDALYAKSVALEAELERVNAQLEGLDTTECGLTCSGCGKVLETEYDFQTHFVIPRTNLAGDLLNLAECPERLPRS